MSVVTELTVDADAFVLGHALQKVPEMTVEGERLVTHSDESVLPFLAARGGSFEAFEEAVAADDTVEEFSCVDSFERTNRYRFVWDEQYQADIREILDGDGMVLGAAASDDTWNLEIQFAERGQLTDLQESFADGDDAVSLERLYEPESPADRADRLTAEQREALELAHEMGFFAVPRETSAADLADHLGISPGAVSERLRRGSATLVEQALDAETE